ncbi:MAG: tripartite tricarboxylate transporter family receptor [Hyphomicrobiales bacterium]|nr:tripartite tricarboxylate transporter family receptor [Hyphomicrobiales bacterium]
MRKILAAIAATAFFWAIAGVPAFAQKEEDFFKGKTISVLIGFGPGGANDVWARLLARHMPRHIPGEPGMVPQNVPGAGTLKLANQLYAVAPRDGTVFGLISRGIPIEPLLGGSNVQLDPQAMTWIGSPDKDTSVCAARKDAKVKTMADLRTTELAMGATGSGADTAIYPEFLADFLGMKFKTIKGYPGSNEIVMAMERNEVQGICVAFQSISRTRMFHDGELNILFQAGLVKDPGIPPDVPLATDMTTNKADIDALRLFLARAALGRPFVAPPGLPPERAEILRRAFMETMKDPAFIAEALRLKLTVEPISGDEIAQTIAEIYRTPADVVQRVTQALGHLAK